MTDTIVLDKDSFKALASDTRIAILKLLQERNHTLSEISHILELAHPTVKEHLTALVKADLVLCRDEGRKWKYYSLTFKGKAVVAPEQKTIMVLLALSIISLGSFFARLVYLWLYQQNAALEAAVHSLAENADRVMESASLAKSAADSSPSLLGMVQQTDMLLVALGIVTVILLVVFIVFYLKLRTQRRRSVQT